MLEVVRNSIAITAPAERVFAFITDPATAPLRMPLHSNDRYLAHDLLQKGDTRETTYQFAGLKWTERRWVVSVDAASMKVIWHTDSRYNLREEWRVEALDAGRCRLVLERQLAPMTLLERAAWLLFTSHATSLVMQERLRMSRAALEGGWRPGGRLRIA